MWYDGPGKSLGLLRYVGLITVLGLALCVTVFVGCADSVASSEGLGVKSFDFTISDTSSDTSLEFFIKLWGENDKLLGTDGTLSVKLWEQLDPSENVKGNPVSQEWNNIPVSKDDFVGGIGIPISLEYKGFTPVVAQLGYVMLTFTADDTSMTVESSITLLLGSCCG